MDGFFTFVFLGNTVKQWIITAACILGGLLAGKICTFLAAGVLKAVGKKANRPVNDFASSVLRRPLFLLIFFAGIAIGFQELALPATVRLWTNRVLDSLFIIIIAWALTRSIDSVISRYVRPGGQESDSLSAGKVSKIQPLLRNFFGILVWVIAGALILRTFGYNVSALMAGLGLGGAALALASKDTLSNFFGSITVFVDKPFRINDRIKIGDYDGFITEMGIRSSKLRTPENRIVFIPNSLFASQPIENISAAPNTKVVQPLRFLNENNPEKIEKGLAILKEIAGGSGLEGSPSAGLTAVGGRICHANFVYYVSRRANYAETVNRVNLEILRRFQEEDIKLI
jgi:MscS family membrane protein